MSIDIIWIKRSKNENTEGTFMPLLKLSVSVKLDDGKKATMLKSLSKMIAETLGKPENYVMVTIETTAMLMSGKSEPAAFADVRSIGALGPEPNRDFTEKLCAFLKDQCGIPANRVYVNFTDVDANYWGWNGSTFG